MSDLSVNGNVTIVEIKKGKGLTHALRELVKNDPNSILSDGKLTAKEEDAAINEIIKIQDQRIANNQPPIFTGGRDKSKNGWRNSFIVQPNQKIEFTQSEMNAIYKALGVTFKGDDNKNVQKADEKKVAAPKDSLATPSADKVKSEQTIQTAQTEPKGRYELSWKEIGKIGLNSAKNFVKGMFCDEDGFSIKRTAATVGTVAGLALAAPVAAALGGSAAVVGAVAGTAKLAGLGLAGYMAYNGGKNVIEGSQKYYDSTTEQEAKQNMSQAMDGAVELTAAIPAFIAIKGGANKGKKMASKEPKPEAPKAEEVKPAEPKVEIPKAEEVKPAEPKVEIPKAEEVKPAEPKVEIPKAEEVKPAEPKVEIPKAEDVKPAEPKVETPKAEEVKPAEPKVEIPKAEEVKPAEPKVEISKAEEVKPAEVKMETKNPEAKNLSDEKNLKELISKLINKDSKNVDLVKRFMENLKGYNNPAFTEAAIQQTLTQSANLLNCGLKVFVENGKILLTLDDGVTYAVKLKTAVKPNATPKAAELKPTVEPKTETQNVQEVKPAEPKVEIPKAKEVKPAEPKVEAPKVQEVKPAEPKVETPKTEEVKPVEPKVEAPKAKEVKPAETSVAEPKPTETKTTEPKVETPKVQEVKPAEAKPEAPKAEETKPVEQKTESVKVEAQPAIDYNKSVRSELKKKHDGTTNEYFYNQKGNMVKFIERDNTGKITYTSIDEYNSSGIKVKEVWQSSTGSICETFYEKGAAIKKLWKWKDGQVDELYPKGNDVYEGVRTYPDGKKVKIRQENNNIQVLRS